MSAPKTNIDRQISRHRGPLYGMIAVGAFVAVLVLGWMFYETADSRDATEQPAAGVIEGQEGIETAPGEPAPEATPPAMTTPSTEAPATPATPTPAPTTPATPSPAAP